ncbi:Chain length determinant protein [Cupriavidus sp. OV038]|jgi:capsular polysaccharide biosynthesis protein|uniref:hypothetical protein n=1 Tax=unclassified Cupriavidus TaxID=2640874 RepID=UPI0008EA90B8|nr:MULTISPECIES: hypothetical protein [unclassified Cupriavidus]SFB78882.1 Chain length determinant protein [Cupriavidus sp. OV038]SFO65759.1 Chain length determinant protein [Cupriavidus sp. OV096]
MEMKSVPAPKSEEEGIVITFEDVVRFLKRHAVKILVLSMAGLVIGVGTTFLVSRQWEAKGVLQIGQVSNEGGNAPLVTQIEPTLRALERLRIPQFTEEVLKRLGFSVGLEEPAAAVLIRRSLKSTMLVGTDLIQFSVRGYSPEEARRAAEGISTEMMRIHADLMRPSLSRLNADLAEVKQGIAREDKRREMLNELVQNRGNASVAAKFSENVLLSEMVSENEKGLRTLRLRQNSLGELMSKERTYNTHLLGPVETSRRAVFPSKMLFGLAGLVVGLVISLLIGMGIDARRRLTQA